MYWRDCGLMAVFAGDIMLIWLTLIKNQHLRATKRLKSRTIAIMPFHIEDPGANPIRRSARRVGSGSESVRARLPKKVLYGGTV